MRAITLILPDVRSAYNVGAVMRTANATGASVWTCGYSPHPAVPGDTRPPYQADRATRLIQKTALGSEEHVNHRHFPTLTDATTQARSLGLRIIALEQAASAQNVFEYHYAADIALVVGSEVTGLDKASLEMCDDVIELPMHGMKESLNVSVAAGIALYALRYSRP